jgi:hypothetical protein
MTTPTYVPSPDPTHDVPATFQPQQAVQVPVYEQQAVPQILDQEAVTSVQVPKGGYAQRITRIPLPELALPGLPEPWLEIRNPGLLSQSTIEELSQGLRGVTTGNGGQPTGEADSQLIMATMAKLLRRWCMWDATSDDAIPPLLPETITLENLNKAPLVALKSITRGFRELQDPQ